MIKVKLAWKETIVYKEEDNLVSNFSEYFIGETVNDCINEAAENYDWRVKNYDQKYYLRDHKVQHNPENKTPIEIYRDLKNIYIDDNGVWQDADVSVYNTWNTLVDTVIARENIFEKTRNE